MKTKELTLWSSRFSVAYGNHFVAERKVTEETAQDWLKSFEKMSLMFCFWPARINLKNKRTSNDLIKAPLQEGLSFVCHLLLIGLIRMIEEYVYSMRMHWTG